MSEEKSLMMKLKASSKDYLKELAKKNNESMTKVIEDLLEEHKNRSFFEGLAADFASLKTNKSFQEAEATERDLWDNTLADGMKDL